jgi:uncharacterized protein
LSSLGGKFVDMWAVLRVALALAVYLVAALLSIVVSRRLGSDIKKVEGRASALVQVIGIVANLAVFAVVLALLVFLDRRSISSVGIRFDSKDLMFLLVVALLTFALSLGFVGIIGRLSRPTLRVRRMRIGRRGFFLVAVAGVLLLVVALQEETLFRAYVGLNLSSTGPLAILVITSVIFTAIHFPTNVGSLWQTVGWFVSGLLLGASYLITGSIWIAIGIHFVTDFLNVLVLNIAGRISMYAFEPPLTSAHRGLFRILQTVLTIGLIVLFYGTKLQLVY